MQICCAQNLQPTWQLRTFFTLNCKILYSHYLQTDSVHVCELILGCSLKKQVTYVFREISLFLLRLYIRFCNWFFLNYRINVSLEKMFLKIDFSLIWKGIRYKGNCEKNTNIAFNRTEVTKNFEITAAFSFPQCDSNYWGRKRNC